MGNVGTGTGGNRTRPWEYEKEGENRKIATTGEKEEAARGKSDSLRAKNSGDGSENWFNESGGVTHFKLWARENQKNLLQREKRSERRTNRGGACLMRNKGVGRPSRTEKKGKEPGDKRDHREGDHPKGLTRPNGIGLRKVPVKTLDRR